MNLPTYLFSDLKFKSLRRKLGGNALIAIVSLGLNCRQRKATTVSFSDAEELASLCDLDRDIEPTVLHDALVGSWLVKNEFGSYDFPFFVEHNHKLIVLWENGRKKAEAASSRRMDNLTELTEPNETKLNLIKLNQTKPNLT